jgi:PIN domain nuclease of toxin-antitoxin system
VWWLATPEKLSARARRAIAKAAATSEITASAISIFEISTLLRRGRLEFGIDPDEWFAAARSLPELTIEPVSAEVAWIAGTFDNTLPGDPADRVIAATAQVLDARLVTADRNLRSAAAVETIW